METMEEWKKIDSVAGNYCISNNGKIKNGNTGKILKTHINRLGREIITLAPFGRQGKRINVRIHRCVAFAFLGDPSGDQEVNHIDGNPQNNCVDNLEWCTKSQNIKHAYDCGLMVPLTGHDNAGSVLTNEQVKMIRDNTLGVSDREYARLFGVHHTTIGRCRRMERYN